MNRDQYLQKKGWWSLPPVQPEEPASQATQGDPVSAGAVVAAPSTDGDSLLLLQQQAATHGVASP